MRFSIQKRLIILCTAVQNFFILALLADYLYAQFKICSVALVCLRCLSKEGNGTNITKIKSVLRIYTVFGKKHPEHYRLSLEVGISNFNNFWYDYFWHNWPSNDHSVLHLTQCLFLHYLGKTKPTKYKLK